MILAESRYGELHYGDVIMGAIASQITSLTIVYSTVYSDADQRIHQSSASLAFVRGIHRRLVNCPHKWPVTRKMFPFDDVIMHVVTCVNFMSFQYRNPLYKDNTGLMENINEISLIVLHTHMCMLNFLKEKSALFVFGFFFYHFSSLMCRAKVADILPHGSQGSVYNLLSIDPFYKFHNALDKYPTMHDFVTEMCTHVHISVTKSCITGYDTGALWGLCNGQQP